MIQIYTPAVLAVLEVQGLHWVLPLMAGGLAGVGLRAAWIAWRGRAAVR